MKIGIADLPWPFLAEPRMIAQNGAGTWHDLHSLMSEAGLGAPETANIAATLSRLSAMGSGGRKKLERALGSAKHPVPSPALAAPIDPLAKILLTEGRVALARSNDQLPAKMVVGFSKFASACAAPGAALRLPDPAARYDVEAVLVAVLGKEASRVSAGEATRSIVGFTLMAEVTNRDMFDREWKTSNNLYAKNHRGLTPLGPSIWVASPSELDPATEITLSLNGAVKQRFAVSDFAHSIANATKAWSRTVLEPGDMVALGAAISKPRPGNEVDSPIEIKVGDKIEVACAPIGTLSATIAG
ncbi:MAG TPA: fumarylacetoacetate hydrolase family protein [Stellaceae bacterium]|jgi:2-keto-4-pentenoate hydratase/2-oxohepta-3-ene-1,7-dioic acid hydratase in catechol pathway|nr:fumarylacetoacetate hydrolase family protein [Stellaceae bacterium]